MRCFIEAVRRAVDQENWYAALNGALALPDICGRIDCPTRDSRRRYVTWFDSFLPPTGTVPGTSPTGADVYALRCAYFHHGEFDVSKQHARNTTDCFRFILPPPGMTIHRNRIGDALQLQVSEFCSEMCAAVERWLDVASRDPVRAPRLERLAEIEIWKPYASGQPRR